MASNVQIMTRQQVRELSVVGQSLEVLDWVLYDTQTIATGGTQTSFRFFQQAIGQGGLSLDSTNMEIPGQLPAGYKFVCQKIVATPKQGLTLTAASVSDIFAVTHRGNAQLFIGTRPYTQNPMVNLIGGGFMGFAASFDAVNSVSYATPRTVVNGELEYGISIPANYSFSVLLNYDLAPTLVADVKLTMQMVGKLIRPRQG